MSYIQYLRSATRQLHSQASEQLQADRIFSANYTLAEFRHHLERLYQAHLFFEAGITPFIQCNELLGLYTFQDFKSGLLKYDLEEIFDIADIDIAAGSDELFYENVFQCLGGCYVIRGSANGVQHIEPTMLEHTKRWGVPPSGYYNTHKNTWSVPWLTFIQTIDALTLTDQQVEELKEGSVRTFKLFLQSVPL